MIINDRIYGRHKISSPVLLELIASGPVQRLKGIMQGGQPKETDTRPILFTRYDHSIGVMLLLKILKASEEEQIAGLLHDVSHTAFSHTIDSVLKKDKSEEFQDSQHKRFLTQSEIPPILTKYGYDIQKIYDYSNFSLLELPLPALCADRVDYSLRESPKIVSKKCLTSLKAFKKKIIFTNKQAAKIFADRFLILQGTSWGGKDHVIREQLFTKALQFSMKKKIISLDDFWQDDNHILTILHKSKERFIKRTLKAMRLKNFDSLSKSHKSVIKYKKFRFVDPDVFINGKVSKLSELDSGFLQSLEKMRKENEEGIAIPVLAE